MHRITWDCCKQMACRLAMPNSWLVFAVFIFNDLYLDPASYHCCPPDTDICPRGPDDGHLLDSKYLLPCAHELICTYIRGAVRFAGHSCSKIITFFGDRRITLNGSQLRNYRKAADLVFCHCFHILWNHTRVVSELSASGSDFRTDRQ